MMPLDMQHIDALVAAVHHPATDNATRAAAQEQLELLKNNTLPEQLFQLGLKLNSANTPQTTRFFGLSLLEFVLRFRWDQLEPIQAVRLKADLVSAFQTAVANSEQSRFITEKMCVLVAQTAERMWPLHWPDFDAFLREIFISNMYSQECALLIYKTLIEDTFCFENSIAELRKKDLSISLIAITVDPAVLHSVYRSSDRLPPSSSYGDRAEIRDVDSIISAIRADNSGLAPDEGWLRRLVDNLVVLKQHVLGVSHGEVSAQSRQAKKLVLLTLDILSTVLQWIILEGIESTRLFKILFELLLSSCYEERIAAADCLTSLFSRTSLVAEEKFWSVVVLPLFDTGGPYLFGTVFEAILGVHQCSEWSQIHTFCLRQVVSEENHEYLKRIAELISVFGERQLFCKHMVQKPPRFESYLELLYFLTVHPSRTISSVAAPLWVDLSNHEHFKTAPEVYQYTARLIQFCILRLSEGDEFNLQMTKKYDEMEFESDIDRRACIDSNRVRYLDILKYMALIEPFQLFSAVDAHIRFLIFSNHPTGTAQQQQFGFVSPSSEIGVQFEHASLLIEHTVKHIPNVLEPNLKDPRLLVGVSNLFSDVISLDAKDPAIVRCSLSVIVCIAESVRDSNSLLKCIEKIVQAVTFTFPDEVGFKERGILIRDETRHIRMKAASSLVKLAVALPDTLITLFNEFVQLIQSFVQGNQILQFERVKLVEFLLALIHYSSKDLTQKALMFSSVIESYAVEWEQLDETPFGSPNEFLKSLGIFQYATTGNISSEELAKIDSWRKRLNIQLRAWMMWMKRTKEPPSLWPAYIFRILPKTLTIVKAIHSLGDPATWQTVPVQYHINLSISEVQKEAILKKSPSKVDPDTSRTFLDATSSWIAGVRETCYTLIGTMITFGPTFYSAPNLSQILLSSVLSNAQFLDNKHWKNLIGTVVRPLFMHCPAAAHAEVLGNIMPQFLQFIQARLDEEWRVLENAKQGNVTEASSDNEEVGEEIVADKILRELTRAYSDLLAAVASPEDGKHGIKVSELAIVEGSVFSHVMTNNVVFRSLFSALLHCMALRDTPSSRKAVVAIFKALPVLMKTHRSDVFVFLGESVMKTCLEVFHDGYFQDIHNEVIPLMGEIYISLRAANNTCAYQTLLALPGMSADALQAFDMKFSGSDKSKKERNVILRQFLKNIKGTSISETFKQFDGKAKVKPQLERNVKRRDVLDANDENVAVLESLF